MSSGALTWFSNFRPLQNLKPKDKILWRLHLPRRPPPSVSTAGGQTNCISRHWDKVWEIHMDFQNTSCAESEIRLMLNRVCGPAIGMLEPNLRTRMVAAWKLQLLGSSVNCEIIFRIERPLSSPPAQWVTWMLSPGSSNPEASWQPNEKWHQQ